MVLHLFGLRDVPEFIDPVGLDKAFHEKVDVERPVFQIVELIKCFHIVYVIIEFPIVIRIEKLGV